MIKLNKIFRHLLLTGLFAVLAFSAFAQAQPPVRVAFLSMDNLSTDPRYDYLSGIVQGILLYDLSGREGLELVERSDMESVLKEQKLALSGLLENTKDAMAFGELLRADYLLKGEYVFLGQDILLTVKLVEVETSKSITFKETGRTDNLIHSLAEKIIQRLTGREVALADPSQNRSIISLKDESPGSIALYSHLIDARIYLNDEFAGYTTGNRRVPFILENVSAGEHTVRTHLSKDFGVIILPQIEFKDWDKTVKVEPGKQVIVEDGSSHFNDLLYRMNILARDSKTFYQGREDSFKESYPFSFKDRKGVPHEGSLTLDFTTAKGSHKADFLLSIDGTDYRSQLSIADDEKAELKEIYGLIDLSADLSDSAGRCEISFYLTRTDIRQGLHREER